MSTIKIPVEEECWAAMQYKVRVFFGVMFLAFVLVIAPFFCKRRFWEKLWRAVYVLGGLATVQFILAILLFTVATPKCPSGCGCSIFSHFIRDFYPSVVVASALLQFYRTYSFYQRAKTPRPSPSSTSAMGIQGNATLHDTEII